MHSLPKHLQKYVVSQNYEKYTSVDHAVWRFVLRQLKSFLANNAHESYLEGLEKTGIEIDRIPRISDISEKLERFGWRALPVSGFIPPAAFMEMQSLGILPIASDMRSVNHLMYTPAPDIVHEAAGHAPMLVNPEFSDYLREYAVVAKKAIISQEDLDLYEAIRVLSDVKENPASTPGEIAVANQNLLSVSRNISHVSEAAELGRMNWWTAEYGLIGDLENPKIFGAGLLSSVGEAKTCLQSKVRKIPLSLKCIETSYDITEPQPQLFVTPNFSNLSEVLEEMATKMSFRIGGLSGIRKAIKAKSVNTVVLSSGLQISGKLVEPEIQDNKVVYLRFQGPCQLSHDDKEIPGHGISYHNSGFGSPLGNLAEFPEICPSNLDRRHWERLGFFEDKAEPQKLSLRYVSGVVVSGIPKGFQKYGSRAVIMSFREALVTLGDLVLFDPSWGEFDLALGNDIVSVFGGPADRNAFGNTEDFVAARVPLPRYSTAQSLNHDFYSRSRNLREKLFSKDELQSIFFEHKDKFPEDWLLKLELYELATSRGLSPVVQTEIREYLQNFAAKNPELKQTIADGIELSQKI